MFDTKNSFILPNSSLSTSSSRPNSKLSSSQSSKQEYKKKPFFLNFKFDLLSSKQKQQPISNSQVIKSQSFKTQNTSIKNNDNTASTSEVSTPSASSKDSFSFFNNCNNNKSDLLKSRLSSPFYLRKSHSEAYKCNPFLLSNNYATDSDQISHISSSTSTTTIRTDSGLSSVDSVQLLCAELKDCLKKGESYYNIEIKFRKSLYAFWCLDEYGNSIFHLAAKYGKIDVLR